MCGSEMCDNQPCQTPVREYTPFLCLYAFLLCCGASVSINTLARLVLLRSQRSGPPAGLEGAGIASGARDVRFLAAALDAGSPHRRAEQTQTGPSRALSPRPTRRRGPASRQACCARCTSPRSHLSRKKWRSTSGASVATKQHDRDRAPTTAFMTSRHQAHRKQTIDASGTL